MNKIEKIILVFGREQMGGETMVALERYWRDEADRFHSIGIIQESNDRGVSI